MPAAAPRVSLEVMCFASPIIDRFHVVALAPQVARPVATALVLNYADHERQRNTARNVPVSMRKQNRKTQQVLGVLQRPVVCDEARRAYHGQPFRHELLRAHAGPPAPPIANGDVHIALRDVG
jgi:hypothetical protein